MVCGVGVVLSFAYVEIELSSAVGVLLCLVHVDCVLLCVVFMLHV